VAIGLLGLAVRLISVTRAYDTFIDEVTYTQVALNIAHGHGVTLYGSRFDLQPPAVLGLLAGIIDLRDSHGSLEQVILGLRPVAAFFGALECAGTYLLLRRAVATRYAVIGAVLMVVNPLMLSYDGLVMLEPFAQAAAVASVGFLAATFTAREPRIGWWYTLAAGIFGGIVVTTKETFGLVLATTMVILLVTGWVEHRRELALALVGTVTGYRVYLTVLGLTSGLGPWWTAKTTGLERIIGTYQPTGYNSPLTHVSLISRAAANASQYGVSYLLLGLGGISAVWLVVQLRPWRSEWGARATPRERVTLLIATWAVVAVAYLSFETLFGSIEEQMYYILALPSTATLIIAASQVRRRTWGRTLAIVLAVCIAFDAAAWVKTRTGDHNNTAQFLRWAAANLPPDSVVSTTEGKFQFLLRDQRIGVWTTVPELREHHVDYVVVDTSLVAQGYSPASPAFEHQLDRLAPIVWQGPEAGGDLRIYDVKNLDVKGFHVV